MKWLKVKVYISGIDLFIRYDDIDYITNGENDIVTTLYMKDGKKIHINRLQPNVINFLLENDK